MIEKAGLALDSVEDLLSAEIPPERPVSAFMATGQCLSLSFSDSGLMVSVVPR